MKFDKAKWNEIRKAQEKNIKELKHSIRKVEKPIMQYVRVELGDKEGSYRYDLLPTGATYRGGTFQEYGTLRETKRHLTCMYAFRAHLRGKDAVKIYNLKYEEEKNKIVEKLLVDFSIAEEKEAA